MFAFLGSLCKTLCPDIAYAHCAGAGRAQGSCTGHSQGAHRIEQACSAHRVATTPVQGPKCIRLHRVTVTSCY